MTDYGSLTNKIKSWGKGLKKSSISKRQDNLEYHPYTVIGFVCTNDRNEPLNKAK